YSNAIQFAKQRFNKPYRLENTVLYNQRVYSNAIQFAKQRFNKPYRLKTLFYIINGFIIT
ncbi:MAG: hypothetical protein ACLR1J_07325, partial [Anaerovoracaceae bacterium]